MCTFQILPWTNKYFILSLSENWENISFPLTGGRWSKSATVITERLTNAFLGMIINTSSNLEPISVHNLFVAVALDFSFRRSNFDPGLIPRPEWRTFPPIFATDKPIGPRKRTLGFSKPLQWSRNVFDIVWDIK